MIQSHNCNSCGYVVPKSWQTGDLCSQCGDSVRAESICAWCCHNVPEGKFCRACGFEMVDTQWFGVARMLKSFGVDKLEIKSRLNELDDADKLHHQQQFMQHWGPIVAQLDEMQFCENYLGTNKFVKVLQNKLLELAPFPDEKLKRFARIEKPPYEKNLATLEKIIEKTSMSLNHEVAMLALLTNCDEEWAINKAGDHLKYIIHNILSDYHTRLQMLLTLSNWRFETHAFAKHIKITADIIQRFDEIDFDSLSLAEKIKLENVRFLASKEFDSNIMEQGLNHHDPEIRQIAALRLDKSERFGEFMSGDLWRSQFLIHRAAAKSREHDLVWFERLTGKQVHFYVRYMPALIPEYFVPALLRAAEKNPEQRWVIWNALHIAGVLNNEHKQQIERFAVSTNDGYTAVTAIKFEFYISYIELSKIVFQQAVNSNDYQYLLYLIDHNLLHEPQEVLSKIGLNYDIISSLETLAELQLFPIELADKLIKFSQSTSDEISKDRIAEIICSQQNINDSNKAHWFPILWRYFVNDSPIFRQYSWPKYLLGFEKWLDKDCFDFDNDADAFSLMFSSKEEFEKDCLVVLERMDDKDIALLSWFEDNRDSLDNYLNTRPDFASQLFYNLTNARRAELDECSSNIIAANSNYQHNVLLNFIYQLDDPSDFVYLFATIRDYSRLTDNTLNCFNRMIAHDNSNKITSKIESFINGYLLSKSAIKFIVNESLSDNTFFIKHLPHSRSDITLEDGKETIVDACLLLSIYQVDEFKNLIKKMIESTIESKNLEIVTWLLDVLRYHGEKEDDINELLSFQIELLFSLNKAEAREISSWGELFLPVIGDFLVENNANQLGQYYQFVANQHCDRSIHQQLTEHLQTLDNDMLLDHLNGLCFSAHAFEFCADDFNKKLVYIFKTRLTEDEFALRFLDENFVTYVIQLLKSFFADNSTPHQAVCKYIIQGLIDAHNQQSLGDNLNSVVELISQHRQTDIYLILLKNTFEITIVEEQNDKTPIDDKNQPTHFDAIPLSEELLAHINNWIIDHSFSESWADICVDYYRSYKDTSALMVLALIPDKLSNIQPHEKAYQSLLDIALQATRDGDLFDQEKEFIAQGSLVIGLLSEYCNDETVIEYIKQEIDHFICSHELSFLHQDALQELYQDKDWEWLGDKDDD